jgi:hypothetical protein
VKLITPEVKRANPSLFAAACKKHFYGTWKKALRAALRLESQRMTPSVPLAEPAQPATSIGIYPAEAQVTTLSA